MKKSLLAICAILLLAISAQSCSKSQSLKGKEIVFVYGGWEGHDPVGCRDLFVPWLESQGATVHQSDNLDIYMEHDIMEKADLIIQCWTMGSISGAQERGLLEAVKNGAGIAGWHGGTGDSFRNSTDYQYMIGGQWVAHPGNIIDYKVKITNHRDKITKGIKDFQVHSEQYYMQVDPNVEVLAETRYTGDNDWWIEDRTIPVVWKTQYGNGRVFYSSLGHTAKDFINCPESFEIMKRGILWAVK